MTSRKKPTPKKSKVDTLLASLTPAEQAALLRKLRRQALQQDAAIKLRIKQTEKGKV